MNKLKIKIILASVRQVRFGDKPAKWIYDIAERMEELSPEILDLLNHQLPMFAEVVSPAYTQGEYRLKEANVWAKKIAEADDSKDPKFQKTILPCAPLCHKSILPAYRQSGPV